jgi:putative signal transducing protein
LTHFDKRTTIPANPIASTAVSVKGVVLDCCVIFQTWNDSEAELVRGIMESYGIPCRIRSDIPHQVVPLTVDGLGEIRLEIPSEAAEEARRILQDHLSAGVSQRLDSSPDDH